MRLTVRTSDQIFLDYDEHSKKGKWIVHDRVSDLPIIRTDNYDTAIGAFIVRVEVRKSADPPEGYERVQVASRDGRSLIRTIDKDGDGFKRIWVAVDKEGTREVFGGVREALSAFLGPDVVRRSLGVEADDP